MKALAFLLFLLHGVSQAAEIQMAIVGDAGSWNSNAKAVRDSIVRANVVDLIMPGDNNYMEDPKYYAPVWQNWSKVGLNFDVVALGNHHGGYDNEIRFFKMPGEAYTKNKSRDVKFIVLNSDNNKAAARQGTWLDSELEAAGEEFVFLVFHHPSYTVSRDHKWEEKRNFQLAVRPVIWKHRKKITALIVGHDHLATILHFDDLPVILSGATHHVRRDRPRDELQQNVRVKTDWYFDNQPYWAKLQIDDQSNSAWVHFIRAKDDAVACSMKLVTGQRGDPQKNCESSQRAQFHPRRK